MRKTFIISISLIINVSLIGQIGFESHLINDQGKEATQIISADADADGDQDIFFCSWVGELAGWYENLDGQGNFSPLRIITTGNLIKNIDVSDLNGDGNVDVILAISNLDEIRWYSNDGNGNFTQEALISSDSETCFSAKTFDLDGDGDQDILSASYGDNTIAWHENIDGEGSFGSRRVISTSAGGASDAIASDIDNDGDLDIFYTGVSDNTTAWMERLDQSGDYGPEQILTSFTINPTKVQTVDLDQDGDLDVFVTAQAAGNIVSWENLDGNGTFSQRQYIDVTMNNASVVVSSDIDSDGDHDFVLGDWNLPYFLWQENYDGRSTLGPRQNIDTDLIGVRSIIAADVDGDGDDDLVVGTIDENSADNGGKLMWYENKNLTSNVLSGNIQIELEKENCDESSNMLGGIRVDALGNLDTVSTFAMQSGYYQLYPKIGTYKTSLSINLPEYYAAFPEDFQTTFDDIGNFASQNFCVLPKEEATDVSVALFPGLEARPGFETPYNLVISNIGTIIEKGEIELEFDETKFEFISTSLPIVSLSSNKIVMSYDELLPLSYKSADVTFRVAPPPTANIGDIVEFDISITPIEEDRQPEDNKFKLIQELVGSYDPNDIRVLEGSEIIREQVDDYLHYIIRFQNTGSASAIHVRVENTLDSLLDWSTFTPIELSHPGRISIKDNKDIIFDFQNIHLPDSTSNEPESHGTITYKIKPIPDLMLKDSIQNTAAIFFDFNPPIQTNIAITELVKTTNILKIEPFELNIYPNPVNGLLLIEMEEIPQRIDVIDMRGQVVVSTYHQNQINLNKLTSGIYQIRILKNEKEWVTRKVIVSR